MPQFRCIVSPTDFSPTAAVAVEHAASLARAVGGRLVLVHVLQQVHSPLQGIGLELRMRAQERLAAVAKDLGDGLEVRTELREGEPHEQVLACAREAKADVIVMGTHGHTGLLHALLGSTAERIMRLAPCPVLTVRAKQ